MRRFRRVESDLNFATGTKAYCYGIMEWLSSIFIVRSEMKRFFFLKKKQRMRDTDTETRSANRGIQ